MKTPEDGGPAFPVQDEVYGNGERQYGANGMSLRDWFAGMAMQGSVAYVNEHEDHYDKSLIQTAVASYKIANAMLAARKAPSGLEG